MAGFASRDISVARRGALRRAAGSATFDKARLGSVALRPLLSPLSFRLRWRWLCGIATGARPSFISDISWKKTRSSRNMSLLTACYVLFLWGVNASFSWGSRLFAFKWPHLLHSNWKYAASVFIFDAIIQWQHYWNIKKTAAIFEHLSGESFAIKWWQYLEGFWIQRPLSLLRICNKTQAIREKCSCLKFV